MIKIEGITMYTIPEAAEALKVTPQTVRAYIKTGKLKAKRIGRPYLISGDSLRAFLLGEPVLVQGEQVKALTNSLVP
jgi:excisionase family DNA binding protein